MKKMFLSQLDTERFHEYCDDISAANMALELAIRHYERTVNDIQKTKRELWDHIYETHNLDNNKEYDIVYSRIDRKHEIIEKDENR